MTGAPRDGTARTLDGERREAAATAPRDARLSPRRLVRAARSPTFVQTLVFSGSSIVVSLLAAVTKALLARHLSTDAFGSFSFATSTLLFVALFFEFGLFLPAARLAARSDARARREIAGASLAVYAPVGIGFAASVFALSFVVDDVFNVHAGSPLRLVAPLAVVYPFGLVAMWLAQGSNRLHVYSISAAVGQLAFALALGGVIVAGAPLHVGAALVLQSLGMIAGCVLAVVWLRPVWRRTGALAATLVRDARAFGFSVYVGRLLSTGTYNMDVLMLGAWTDAETVGFYALAGAIAAASGLPVIGMAQTLFPRMVEAAAINARWLRVAWVVGLASAAAVSLLSEPFVRTIFSDAYAPATALIPPLALAQVVRGVTSVYNQYLSAQAAGRDLRNAALVLTASNIVLNFALIPSFGAQGAAWASLVALVANLLAHVYFYRRRLRLVAAR